MNRLFLSILCAALTQAVHSQQVAKKAAPEGFDVARGGIARGRIDSVYYESKTVGTKRRVIIYTPPGYSAAKKYPVLYLLHGIGGDEKEWLVHGTPQVIFDNMYAAGKMEPMIVVMPNGRAMPDDRAIGNMFDSARVKAFSTFEFDLLDDLIPFIEKQYPVHASRKQRALAGLSMGGGQSLNFGLSHPDRFAWIGGFSSAPNTRMPDALVPDIEAVKKQVKLLWISCGDKDRLLSITQRTHEFFKQQAVPHIYHLEPGDHDFKVWKNDLYLFCELLFKPVKKETFEDY